MDNNPKIIMWTPINYFVDHDLPVESAKAFLAEFDNRICGNQNWKIKADTDACNFESYFPNTQGNIIIYNFDENLKIKIELDLSMKTLQIFNLPHFDEITCFWEEMNEAFSKNTELAKKRKNQLVSVIEETLKPLFHTTKLILFKQDECDEHITLYKEKLIENGCSIEDVFAYNSSFKQPCAILRNESAFGHSPDLYQPIYIFDL